MSTATIEAVEAVVAKTESDPLKRICISRLVRAVEELPQAALEQIGKTATGAAAIYRCIIQPEFEEDLQEEDPLAQARLRGKETSEKLLAAEGGCATVSEVAQCLSMTKQGVNRRRQNNRLIAIDRGRKGVLYPRWQFSEKGKGGVLEGLEEVLAVLRTQGVFGWGVVSFFLNPDVDLGGQTPLDALRQGKKEDVLFAAGAWGEMGK